MRHGLKTAICGVAAVLAMSGPLPARAGQTHDHGKVEAAQGSEELVFNEEAVRKLLEESDPDVAFLGRLKMMRGHIGAALAMAEAGDAAEAKEHFKHPSSEILPEIAADLTARKLGALGPALDKVVASLDGDDLDATRKATEELLVEIAAAEASIEPAKMSAKGIVPQTMVLLLRTAATEYGVAYEYGKISNRVEYHDGSFFVTEAAKLLAVIEPEVAQRDPAAIKKIKTSWAELEKAWPGVQAPAEAAVPVSKLLALVTIIELQLYKLVG